MERGSNQERRCFLGAVALTIAAAELATIRSAEAQSQKTSPQGTSGPKTFGSLKQIDAGVLNIGYAEVGPPGNNRDHVAIVIHSYRWRLGVALGEAKYDALEKELAQGPVINVPTITLEGDANGAPHPDAI